MSAAERKQDTDHTIVIAGNGMVAPNQTTLRRGDTVVFRSKVSATVQFRDASLFGTERIRVGPRRLQRLNVNREAPHQPHFFRILLRGDGPPIKAGDPCIIVDGGPD